MIVFFRWFLDLAKSALIPHDPLNVAAGKKVESSLGCFLPQRLERSEAVERFERLEQDLSRSLSEKSFFS